METEDQSKPSAEPELQFDRADFGEQPAGLACAGCKQPIADTYFQVGAASFCPKCKAAVEKAYAVRPGVWGFARAAFFGSLAAAAGSLLYFGIRWLTGYEFGLISILIGVFVGQAVRNGSGGRGGLLYQLLAVFLTYTAIVSTYVPLIVSTIVDHGHARKKGGIAAERAPDSSSGADSPVRTVSEANEEPTPAQSLRSLVMGSAFIVGVCFAIPFMMMANPTHGFMGLVIIGIGLWEAWKVNKWIDIRFTGPFELRPAAPPPPVPDV